MLAHPRIVFLDRHLLGHGPCVLFRDIEKAGIGRAVQPDLDGGWLGHGVFLVKQCEGRLTYLATLLSQGMYPSPGPRKARPEDKLQRESSFFIRTPGCPHPRA